MRLLPAFLALATSALIAADVPAGFTSLFNGQDLAGWHGYNPHSVAKLTGEKKDAMLKKMREEFSQHWSAKDGEIYNAGTGPYATTDRDYGDFELTLEYNMAPKGDSGVYLRGATKSPSSTAASSVPAPFGTIPPASPARTRSSWPTSLPASGTPSAS